MLYFWVRTLAGATFAYGLTTCLMVGPVQADWQYTRWGMTQQQVVRASRGAAKHEGSKLVAPYRTGTFDFRVEFSFEADRLASVQLKLIDPTLCPRLYASLRDRYGEPPRGGHFVRWDDRQSNNKIIYAGAGTSLCSIFYGPLTSPANKGL